MSKIITEVLQKVGNDVIPIELGTDSSNPLIEQRVTALEEKTTGMETNISNNAENIANNTTKIEELSKKVVPDNKTIEFNEQEEALKVKIVEGGGLVVSPDSKGLVVDFDEMDPTRFENMLKAIRVPIWLESNKSFYVNKEIGSDTLDDKRGESEDNPFKSIQACIDYVSSNFNINKYIATIYVQENSYPDNLVMPDYSRTTGYIKLKGVGNVTIGNAESTNYNVISANTPTKWYFDGFNILVTNKNLTTTSAYPTAILADRYSYFNLKNISITLNQEINSLGGTINRIRGIEAIRNGSIDIGEGCSITANYTDTVGNKITGIISYTNGLISIQYNENSDNPLSINGDYAIIASAEGGFISRGYPANPLVIGEATGKRYSVTLGGWIDTHSGGPNYFPGSIEGTVDKDTFGWYN